jgi:hypothetical protein
MIKVGLRFHKADLQVAERLPRLPGQVVGDHAARAVDTVLAADHDQSCPAGMRTTWLKARLM